MLRIEPLNRHDDQAPSAILELVDGPRDMRFALTAKTIVRERAAADDNDPELPESARGPGGLREITARNIRKVTRFRPDGLDDLEREVVRLERFAKVQQKERERRERRGAQDGQGAREDG